MNVRGRVLNVAGTLRAEARRSKLPTSTRTEPSLLESLAGELEDAAREMLNYELLDLDGPAADGPAEVQAVEDEAFEAQDTQPLMMRIREDE